MYKHNTEKRFTFISWLARKRGNVIIVAYKYGNICLKAKKFHEGIQNDDGEAFKTIQ